VAGHLVQQPWGPDMACDVGAANGDGGPATEAALCAPLGLAWGPGHDYLYVSEWTFPFLGPFGFPEFGTVRRIDKNGIITTFAGNGDQSDGDGLPATEAGLSSRPGAKRGRPPSPGGRRRRTGRPCRRTWRCSRSCPFDIRPSPA